MTGYAVKHSIRAEDIRIFKEEIEAYTKRFLQS